MSAGQAKGLDLHEHGWGSVAKWQEETLLQGPTELGLPSVSQWQLSLAVTIWKATLSETNDNESEKVGVNNLGEWISKKLVVVFSSDEVEIRKGWKYTTLGWV